MVVPASELLPGVVPTPRNGLIGREAERATAETLLLADAVPC
ncbi:MAG TPA: hypothetical protein VFQ80_10315 [Thermomicrobiales bacterium]|jgi:hypothetical protein|nr:hypothetical protein [Thermomicrobiales bacterium]